MKKNKQSFLSILFSAAIATVLFCVLSRLSFLHFWKFDLFSSEHWHHILGKWQKGWVLHSAKEYIFVIALLLSPVIYIAFCFLVYLLPLKKTAMLPLTFIRQRKKTKLEAASIAAAIGPSSRFKAPPPKDAKKKARVSSPEMDKIDRLRGKAAQPQQHAAASSSAAEGKTNNAVQSLNLWDGLADELEKAGVFVTRHIKVEDCSFNLFAITQNALFLISEGPAGNAVWETYDEADPPVWKTIKETIPSPVAPMIKAKKTLQEYFKREMPEYSGLSVNCCLIMDQGDIMNPDAFISFLERNDVSALKAGSCNAAELPDSQALVGLIKQLPASSREMNDSISLAILDLMTKTEDGK